MLKPSHTPFLGLCISQVVLLLLVEPEIRNFQCRQIMFIYMVLENTQDNSTTLVFGDVEVAAGLAVPSRHFEAMLSQKCF